MDTTTQFDQEEFERALGARNLPLMREMLAEANLGELVDQLHRLPAQQRAVAYRLLSKDRALEVFEELDATSQGELIQLLRDDETVAAFETMDPDDRVSLIDELPAVVAARLMSGLSATERDLTTVVLGYPKRSIGRQMSPEVLNVHDDQTVEQAMNRVIARLRDSETIYTICVTDRTRRLVGVLSLRDLLEAQPDVPVASLMEVPDTALATEPAEDAARRCAERHHLALPVVDMEDRLVGIFTVDDALQILEDAQSEDVARLAGSEPLRRHYLSTPIPSIVRSRVVWLLVLAVGASLTVKVLGYFEDTLTQQVILSFFVPLLIGTGGNTGNQAATTVTRSLALGEVQPRDITRIIVREFSTGALLGLTLGGLGFAIMSIFYTVQLGAVIGLTLLAVCSLAATVGGTMPLAAKALRADPAVFSNPFISTFVDAAGLVIYFLIAKAILGL